MPDCARATNAIDMAATPSQIIALLCRVAIILRFHLILCHNWGCAISTLGEKAASLGSTSICSEQVGPVFAGKIRTCTQLQTMALTSLRAETPTSYISMGC